MKKALRAILPGILCVMMCLCLAAAAWADRPVLASGDCGASVSDLTWTLYEDGELVISGEGEMPYYNSGTAPWYKNRVSITSLTVEDGVTLIGSYAFYYCTRLTDVTLSQTVRAIAYHAFDHCTKLTAVEIPAGVGIGEAAFSGCSALTGVTIPEGAMHISGSAFAGCSSLTDVTIPEGVTDIGAAAFSGCSALTRAALPSTLLNIDRSAFSGCGRLTDITIPAGVRSIGSTAFKDCTSLVKLSIPDGVTSIGDSAFAGCAGLADVTIPESVTSLGYSAFSGCAVLTDITIPAGVAFIPGDAFSDCKALTSVTIPEGITMIGGDAFSGCTALETVTIPEDVATIGPSAFSGCGLRVVIYGGSEQQWGNIQIESGNAPLQGARIFYNGRAPETYSVTCLPNGGEGVPDRQSVPEGEAVRLPGNIFSREGYAFLGWNTAADGSGDAYAPDTGYVPTGSMTLFAQWARACTVSFYPNGGNGAVQTQIVPADTATALRSLGTLSFNPPVGMVFTGWNTSADGAGVHYADSETVTLQEDLALYARWEAQIRVTFNANGAYDAFGSMPDRTVGAGVSFPAPECGFSRDSMYAFKYWTKTPADPGEAGETYPTGALLTLYENTTLYAQWQKIRLTGSVSLIGSASGNAELAVWGETLTADVYGEEYFREGLVYTWKIDGVEVQSGSGNSYLIKPEDFGKGIVCTVSHPWTINQIDSGTIRVGTYIEGSRIIVNNGDKTDAHARTVSVVGVVPGMIYTRDGEALTAPEALDGGVLEITEPGTYVFGPDTYEIGNWYSVGWSIDFTSDGNGAVRIKNFGDELPAGWGMFPDPIQYDGSGIWLVRENAVTDLTINMRPAADNYIYYRLNGGDEQVTDAEITLSLEPVTGPRIYDIRFSRTAPSVPVAPIDEAHFPDPAFRSYVRANFDGDGDGILTDTEIDRITTVSCSNYGIRWLKGIELFDKLRVLYCQSNNLTNLDLSGNPALTALSCSDNALTALDLSACPNLATLNCSTNALTRLDLRPCPGLTTLSCAGNALAALDVGACGELSTLDCSGNLLMGLDLTGSPLLRSLNCADNLIGALDLGVNSALATVNCQGNLLTALDLSGKASLTTLTCSGNLMTWLDLSGCGSLRTLNCAGNDLSELYINGCAALATVNCQQNALAALDFTSCSGLRRVNCSSNRLTALDLGGYPLLTSLTCQSNLLSELRIDACPALKALTCQGNALQELDLSGCTALLTLMESVEPVARGGVVTYGGGASNSTVLSFDEGVAASASVPAPDLVLPAALTVIGDEAFVGGAFRCVKLSEQTVSIGRHAFAACPNLAYVYVPAAATDIDPLAFGDRTALTILGEAGTAAQSYAREHGYGFIAVS